MAYGWDDNNNLTSKNTTGFGPAASNTYTYDASGNRIQVGSNVYTYDARDQLTGRRREQLHVHGGRGPGLAEHVRRDHDVRVGRLRAADLGRVGAIHLRRGGPCGAAFAVRLGHEPAVLGRGQPGRLRRAIPVLPRRRRQCAGRPRSRRTRLGRPTRADRSALRCGGNAHLDVNGADRHHHLRPAGQRGGPLPGQHAEVSANERAKDLGLKPRALASYPHQICPACQQYLKEEKFRISEDGMSGVMRTFEEEG